MKRAAARVVDYAERHHYIPGESAQPPGDDPHYVLKADFGYRCVFSYTVMQGRKFRDLSVSIGGESSPHPNAKFPHPYAFYTIAADLFGFTGWDHKTIDPAPADWMLAKDPHYNAIRVAQEIA